MFPSGYNAVSRSSSTTICLINVENFRGGALSFARWFGIWVHSQFSQRNKKGPQHRARTSSSLPSILNDHAGMPSPVSGLTLPPDSFAPCCHACPEVIWLKNTRSVRVVCKAPTVGHKRQKHYYVSNLYTAHGMWTNGNYTLECVLHLDALARHRPVEPALHLKEVPVHLRVR